MDVKESAAKADPVIRAVAAIRGAQDRLVRLVANADEAVSGRARAALTAQDPPPVWPVMDALLKARDATLRLKLVGVLAAMGSAEPVRVVLALNEAAKVETHQAIKRAILNTMIGVGASTLRACEAPDRGTNPGTPPDESRGEDARSAPASG